MKRKRTKQLMYLSILYCHDQVTAFSNSFADSYKYGLFLQFKCTAWGMIYLEKS